MKSDFYIDRVSKEEIKDLLYTHHYLKDESKDFKSGYNYGLFRHTDWECPLRIGGCLAVCIFTHFCFDSKIYSTVLATSFIAARRSD